MQIRPATIEDIPALTRMIHSLSAYHGDASPLSEAFLREHAFGPQPFGIFAIAEEDGRPLGFYMHAYRIDYPFACRNVILHLLYVEEAARGRGIGRSLIVASIRTSLEADCQNFRISAEKDNEATLGVYRRFGFSESESESGSSKRFDANRALMEKIVAQAAQASSSVSQ